MGPVRYSDEQLAAVVAGLSVAMRRIVRECPTWPPLRTVEALHSRGLMEHGWELSERGKQVRAYLRKAG